ncbi:MAG: hypothetical protein NVV63_14905 [Opitutus sp.]|nr:hypothetical protein [Opitutus sp.]
MKLFLRIVFVFAGLCSVGLASVVAATDASALGAWRLQGGRAEHVLIVTDGYWSRTVYDREARQFLRTFGGTYWASGDNVEGKIEFDSQDRARVGEFFRTTVNVDGDVLRMPREEGGEEVWERIDDGRRALAGTWRITGRMVDGTFSEMPLRARRTLKILSGTRFQWVAINVETGEFSGTGGGTYTFESGRYTENIEFFSRDSSRVGAQLAFDGEVNGDTWRHRGRSSRGDPIDETWERFATASN